MTAAQDWLYTEEKLRDLNQGLDGLSSTELAELAPNLRGAQAYLNSSGFIRGMAKLNKFTSEKIAQPAESFLENVGMPKMVSRGVGMLGETSPEMAVAMSTKAIPHPFIRTIAQFGLPMLTAGGRTKAAIDDPLATAGSAIGMALGMGLSRPAGAVGRRVAGPNASPISRGVAGATGATVGGAVGDVAEIAAFPRPDLPKGGSLRERAMPNLVEFFGDPTNVGAYLIANTPFAAMDFLESRAISRYETGKGRRADITVDPRYKANVGDLNFAEAQNVLNSRGIEVPQGANPEWVRTVATSLDNPDLKNYTQDVAEYLLINSLPEKTATQLGRIEILKNNLKNWQEEIVQGYAQKNNLTISAAESALLFSSAENLNKTYDPEKGKERYRQAAEGFLFKLRQNIASHVPSFAPVQPGLKVLASDSEFFRRVLSILHNNMTDTFGNAISPIDISPDGFTMNPLRSVLTTDKTVYYTKDPDIGALHEYLQVNKHREELRTIMLNGGLQALDMTQAHNRGLAKFMNNWPNRFPTTNDLEHRLYNWADSVSYVHNGDPIQEALYEATSREYKRPVVGDLTSNPDMFIDFLKSWTFESGGYMPQSFIFTKDIPEVRERLKELNPKIRLDNIVWRDGNIYFVRDSDTKLSKEQIGALIQQRIPFLGTRSMKLSEAINRISNRVTAAQDLETSAEIDLGKYFNKESHNLYEHMERLLYNFITAINGVDENVAIKELDYDRAAGYSGFFEEKFNTATFVKNATAPHKMYYTLVHELTHLSLTDFTHKNPEKANQLIESVYNLGYDSRFRILESLATAAGLNAGDFNLTYLAGNPDVENIKNNKIRIAEEFTAGITEILGAHTIKTANKISTKLVTLLSYLPQPIQNVIQHIRKTIQQIVDPATISIANQQVKRDVRQALGLMNGTLLKSELINAKAYQILGDTSRFDPSYIENHLYDSFAEAVRNPDNPPKLQDYLPKDVVFSLLPDTWYHGSEGNLLDNLNKEHSAPVSGSNPLFFSKEKDGAGYGPISEKFKIKGNIASIEQVDRIISDLGLDEDVLIQPESYRYEVYQELQNRGFDGGEFYDQRQDTGDMIKALVLVNKPKEFDQILPKQNISSERPADLQDQVTYEAKKKLTKGEDYLMSFLSLAQRYSFIRPVFDALRDLRRMIKEHELNTYAHAGQNEAGTFNQSQALKNFHNKLYTRSKNFKNVLGWAADENQRRQELADGEAFDKVTIDEIAQRLGGDREEAVFMQHVLDMPQRIAHQEFMATEQADAYTMARLIYSKFPRELRKQVDPQELVKLTKDLTIFANSAVAGTNPRLSRNALEVKLREILAGKYTPESLAFGEDTQINALIDVATSQAKARVGFLQMLQKTAYVPRIRRGRWHVAVEKLGDNRQERFERRGFKNKQDAQAWANEQGKIDGHRVKLVDMADLAQRYEFFALRDIEELKQKTQDQFKEVKKNYIASLDINSPDYAAMVEAIDGIDRMYNPLLSDVKAAIAAKGDPFAQHREDIPGWDPDDYLPNILEYVAIKAAKLQKNLTLSQVDLEMTRPDYQEVQGLFNKVKDTVDYAMNSERGIWNNIRHGVFLYYLGASIRHLTQNMTQVFLTGVPQLVAYNGGNYFKAIGSIRKAYSQTYKWGTDGTTGDPIADLLLKKADRNQVTRPSSLDIFLNDAMRGEQEMGRLAKLAEGTVFPFDKAKIQAGKAMEAFEKVLRSTAEFGEIVNRTTSFLAAVDNARKLLGKKELTQAELDQVYTAAKRYTDDVNYVGDRSNRPGFITKLKNSWTHGPILTMTALQSFTINYISQVATYMKNSISGEGAIDLLTYKKKKGQRGLFNMKDPNQRAAAVAIGHLLLLSGTMGLVAMKDLDQLSEKLLGFSIEDFIRKFIIDSGETLFDLDESQGNLLADSITQGIPGLLGIDAGISLGMGSVLNYNRNNDFEQTLGSILGGPALGIVDRGWRGAKALGNGEFDTAVRQSMPIGLNYWLRNAESFYEGVWRNTQGVPENKKPLEKRDLLASSLGFTPMSVTNQRKFDMRRRNNELYYADKKRDLINRVAKLMIRGDITTAQNMIKAFQERWPEQETGGLLDSISGRAEALRSGYQLDSPPSLLQARHAFDASQAYPTARLPVQSRVSQRLNRLSTSSQLDPVGADVMRHVQGLQDLPQDALIDLLIQAGMSPAQYEAMTSGNIQDLLRYSKVQPELRQSLPEFLELQSTQID